MNSLQDKVVLITGASSGIGAGIAQGMAQRGARVALTGRSQDNLEKMAEQCRIKGAQAVGFGKTTTVAGDLTKSEDVARIIDHVVRTMGTIHVLVNNAGSCILGGVEESDISVFDNMYETNVRCLVLITKLAMPHIIENKGSIVNVSSISGSKPLCYYTAYSMAKASVNHFTQCLALELASKGVRVNAVTPGLIDTPMFVRQGGYLTEHPEKVKDFLAAKATEHPLGRVGTVDEVSDAVCFLASDAASFVTGALLPVDGGRHCTVSKPTQDLPGDSK